MLIIQLNLVYTLNSIRVMGGKCPLFLESVAFVKFSAINLSKGIDGKKSGQMQV